MAMAEGGHSGTAAKGKRVSFRFDVAFSFPGEHRDYVRRVDEELSKLLAADHVFYDDRYTAELARPDLDTYLQDIYHNDADLIVIFICEDYDRKEWCRLEWRAIRDLLKKRRGPSIMLFRVDDGEVAGIFSIDGYVDARRKEPREAAALIYQRLQFNRKGETPTRPF
jgi:hypothetical protein